MNRKRIYIILVTLLSLLLFASIASAQGPLPPHQESPSPPSPSAGVGLAWVSRERIEKLGHIGEDFSCRDVSTREPDKGREDWKARTGTCLEMAQGRTAICGRDGCRGEEGG